MFTGTLGSLYSQPGNIQPGYFCTGIAVWKGPFPMQLALAPFGDANQVVNPIGHQFSVTTAVASQLAAGEPNFWTFH